MVLCSPSFQSSLLLSAAPSWGVGAFFVVLFPRGREERKEVSQKILSQREGYLRRGRKQGRQRGTLTVVGWLDPKHRVGVSARGEQTKVKGSRRSSSQGQRQSKRWNLGEPRTRGASWGWGCSQCLVSPLPPQLQPWSSYSSPTTEAWPWPCHRVPVSLACPPPSTPSFCADPIIINFKKLGSEFMSCPHQA